jgi:LysM repeat protein
MMTLSITLAFTLLVAAAPQSVAAQTCKFRHTVKAGESLIIIANLYQTDWLEIAEANDLKEPYALTVGQKLCIPSGTAPGADDTPSSEAGKPTLEGVPAMMHVLVLVENFPKNKVYNVRVGDGPSGNLNSTFFKVGRLKTNKNGKFEGYFRMPPELQVERSLVVCLKDPFTDKTTCSDYENPYNYILRTYYSCSKPGR